MSDYVKITLREAFYRAVKDRKHKYVIGSLYKSISLVSFDVEIIVLSPNNLSQYRSDHKYYSKNPGLFEISVKIPHFVIVKNTEDE